MNKQLLILLLGICCFNFAIAQEFQGKAIYQSKTTVDVNLDNREISEEQKQRIRERVKNNLERSYELTFDRTASLYVQEEKLEVPTSNGGGRRGGPRFALGQGTGKYYKNIQAQNYVNESELLGKQFLIKDNLSNWEWKLSSETKKIGNYTCYKATTVQKADTTMLERFRGLRPGPRGNRDSGEEREAKKDTVKTDSTKSNSLLSRIEAPKERIITAWYAPEIPISQGPGPYWGLPGLILEINDGRTAILCSKIILNTEEKEEIKAPSKGKEVSQQEYDKIVSEKMKEMSERFRGGNRGGGNGGRLRG
ncbi:MAG: GLPGLI family protein [Flavobacteriaceae bacterium]